MLYPDAKFRLVADQLRPGKGQEAQLVVGVRGVGNQLAQEDFAMAVES